MNSTTSTHPRQPRLVFRVGVVGHRPNRLQKANFEVLRALVRDILLQTRTAVEEFTQRKLAGYSTESPGLRALSPLAEGVDRLFAEEALTLGYELCCPMPFARPEYENDFLPPSALEPQSLQRFHGILEGAREQTRLVTFELDGRRAESGAAYQNAGRIVLNQSDLLLIVWDGQNENKTGGTEQTLREAAACHLPIVWIDAHAPHHWQVLKAEDVPRCMTREGRCRPVPNERTTPTAIRELVLHQLELPQAKPRDHVGNSRPDPSGVFFREHRPRFNWQFIWPCFRSLLGEFKWQSPLLAGPDFERPIGPQWATLADRGAGVNSPPSETVMETMNRQLRPFYEWPDKLASLYADAYRSAFLLAYLLGTVAVLLVLLPLVLAKTADHRPFPEGGFIGAELIVVISIMGLTLWGRRRFWHERWMEYRLVAELIRQLRILLPLGGGPPFPRQPAHRENFMDPVSTWMFWYVRAVGRATELPCTRVDHAYLAQCLDYFDNILEDQIKYHQTTHARLENLAHRLHCASLGLLWITVASIVLHFLPHLLPHLNSSWTWEWPEPVWQCLTIFCAWFPALGAAFAAISNQGEFARIAKRSRAMAGHLACIRKDLADLKEDPSSLTSEKVTPLAFRASQVMVDEVLDWLVVFLDRPLMLHA